MNKLSYGILSLLSVESQSGYELTQKMKIFWHTNHSAIYTLLSELENKNYVSYELQPQEGKPDKKIYSLAATGFGELKQWISRDLPFALRKDELVFKLFCMEVLEDELLFELLDQVEKRSQEKIVRMRASLVQLQSSYGEGPYTPDSKRIGSFFLLQKGLYEAQLELAWSQNIRNFIAKGEGVNLSDLAFDLGPE